MLSPKLITAFNDQINAEMWSSNLYLSMSVHMARMGYGGFALWMKKQSQEEMEHAYKMIDYMVKREAEVTIGVVNVVPTGWGTPLEIFEHAYHHEVHISEMIDRFVDLAAADKDKPSQDFLWGFVREQVEEEATTKEVVDKLRLLNGTNLLFLDNLMGQRTK